jgi:hypothetical protein
VVDRFVIWEGGIGERHKQSTEQNTKTKNTNVTRTRVNHDGHKLNKVTETKICSSKGYRTAEDMIFSCLAFSVDLSMKTVNKLKDTQVYLTGNPKYEPT